MPEIFAFYEKYIELRTVLRKGWLLRHVNLEHPENDMDHTLQTVLLASLIIRKYELKDINLLKVLEMLTIHEIGEIIIGDIALIEKDYEAKKREERAAVKKELSNLGNLFDYYFGLWCEFEDKESRDAQFALFIDKLDAIMKAKVYDSLTNRTDIYQDFYQTSLEVIKDSEYFPILEELSRI